VNVVAPKLQYSRWQDGNAKILFPGGVGEKPIGVLLGFLGTWFAKFIVNLSNNIMKNKHGKHAIYEGYSLLFTPGRLLNKNILYNRSPNSLKLVPAIKFLLCVLIFLSHIALVFLKRIVRI
jgi:hypothetical protein